MQAGGRTGKAAKAVSDVLTPHFAKEEKYALPQLGVISRLGGVTPAPKEPKLSRQEREDLITRTDRFREELPKMLEEHKAIGAAVEKLHRAAEAEKKPEQLALAEQIRQHAKTEADPLSSRTIDRRVCTAASWFSAIGCFCPAVGMRCCGSQ
jgi:hypothetical protein